MSRQRTFVTGGAGFLGRALVCELLAQGLVVRCLVRRPDAALRVLEAMAARGVTHPQRLEFVFGSLGDQTVDPRWLADCDAVVHAAGVLRGAPSVLVRGNVVATRAIANAAVASRIQRFVLVSSLSVYASHTLPSGSIVDETCPVESAPERRGAYVYSKVLQEAVCREVADDGAVPVVVVRPGVIFGPGRSCLSDRVGPRLGRMLAVVDPERRLPYTFVANCASAVAAAVLTKGIDGETFNIVDDQIPTAGQLADAYRESNGDVRVVRVPGWAATSASRLYACLHARTHARLPSGFLPYVTDPLYKPTHYCNASAKARLQWRPHVNLRAAFEAIAERSAPRGGDSVYCECRSG